MQEGLGMTGNAWGRNANGKKHGQRSRSRLFSLLITSTVLASAGLIVPQFAHAQQQVSQAVRFDIPAQPLASAISAFMRASDWDVGFTSSAVAGKRSTAVSGSMSPAQALNALLAGTGIRASISGPSTAALVSATEGDAIDANGATVLGTISVTSAPGYTEGSGSYTAQDAAIGKGVTSLRETPQAVSIITRQRIEDQNLTTLSEALEKTTGLTSTRAGSTAGSSLGNDTNFYSRGFPVGNIRIDGGAAMETVMNGFGSISGVDMAQYDHVEFMRGIDGLYSSTGDPGGTINLVRKRALAQKQTTISASAGSWDKYRIEADTTGALNDDGSIRGRIGGSFQDQNFFYDTAKMRNGLVYGSLEFDITPETLLTIGGSYKKADGIPDFAGLPRFRSGAALGLPRETSLIPDWSYTHDTTKEVYAKLEHKFNEDWGINANVLYSRMRRDHSGAYTFGAVDPVTGSGSYLYSFPEVNTMNRVALDVNVQGSFDAFGNEHEVVIGTDFQRGRADSSQYTGYQGLPISALNPVFPGQNLAKSPLKDSYYTTEKKSLYGMVRLGLTDDLHVITGARYSNYSYASESWETNGTGYAPGLRHLSDTGVITPYLGLTYDISSDWTAYASYAETYKPQYMNVKGPSPGTPLDAVEAKNYEVGIKGAVLGGAANVSFALYRIDQTGAGVEDPRYPLSYGAFNCCYLNQGNVVSQGFEAEISGEVLPGLQLSAGYTFNSNDDKDNNQSYSTITPRHMLKLWSTYDLTGSLEGWSVGGGATMQSSTFVRGTAATLNPSTGEWDGPSIPFEFTQGGYAIWSARVDYQVNPNWNIAFNANNLLDKEYYSTVGSTTTGNFYGEPRNFTLTVTGKF